MTDQQGIEILLPLAAHILGRSLDDPAITDPVHQILFPFIIKLNVLGHYGINRTEEDAWGGDDLVLALPSGHFWLEWHSRDELKISPLELRDGRLVYPEPYNKIYEEAESTPLTWTIEEGLQPLVFPIKAESDILVGIDAGGGREYYFQADGSITTGLQWIY